MLGSLLNEATVDFLTIDLEFKLIDTTAWRFRIVPKAKGTDSDRLFEDENDIVGLSFLVLVLVAFSRSIRVPLGVLVRRQPDVVISIRSVLAINEVVHNSDIVTHALQGVNSSWVGIDPALVSSSTADIEAVLVVDLDPIETNVKEVTVRRIQVELEHEAHWHSDRLIFLEVLNWVSLSVQTALHRDDLLVGPTEIKRKLDGLCNVFDSIHGARSDTQRDSLLRSHKPFVKTDDHLPGASKCILHRLVVVVELDG